MRPSHTLMARAEQGFTLVEAIVGIVLLAISFSILTTLIYPIAEQSADQLHQVKAAELAQSVLNEIQNKSFDENSDRAGGIVRCAELGTSCSTVMGKEGSETRATFNDVDDYNGLQYGSLYGQGEVENSTGQVLSGYSGYAMQITVCNDANYDGACYNAPPPPAIIPSNEVSTAKLITVIITTPTGNSIPFATYRDNF